MWTRRVLQAELGSSDALIQLSLDALKRFAAAQPVGGAATVSYRQSTGGGKTAFLYPGTDWGFTSLTRSVTVTSLALSGLDADSAGNARARWAVGLSGADTSKSTFGRLLFGGVIESSPLGQLVQQYEGLYGQFGPGLIASELGKPVAVASSESAVTWFASAELVTPLVATIRAPNGAITVSASLAGATLNAVSSPSFNASSNTELQTQLGTRLVELLAGRIPALCPEISIIGALANNESASEALPMFCRLRVAGSPATALSVFAAGSNAATPPTASTNLTGGADCAYLTRESVIQKTLAFCLRTNRFPRHWRTDTVTQSTDVGPVNVQTSYDIATATMSLEPFATGSARQEDRADLLTLINPTIVSVTRGDGSAVPQEVRDQITVEGDINLTTDLYFSNVGTPAMNPDPQLDSWFQQWRSQVSRRFSVPFTAIAGATLLERSLNGVEKVLLTRQSLVF